jgi:uracil-DNA glycosylase
MANSNSPTSSVAGFGTMIGSRTNHETGQILSEKDVKELRDSLAHLSVTAVRDFYEQAYRECRLVYNRLPSPKQMQTLVQVWKQLWKWRGP